MIKLEYQTVPGIGGSVQIDYDGTPTTILYETYEMLVGLFQVMADEEGYYNFPDHLVELIKAHDIVEDECE